MIADKDLISIQQARILAENAFSAQKRLGALTQEALDVIVEAMADAVESEAQSLAIMSHEESDSGVWQDKLLKNLFVCRRVRQSLRDMRCVGVLGDTPPSLNKGLYEVGVPLGVIAALCPVTSPVSTTVYNTLLAIKSGNAIVFSPHPRVVNTMRRVIDIMINAGYAHGMPEGALACLDVVSTSGAVELMRHPHISLLMLTGVPSMYAAARASGKALIYGSGGGMGNGLAFIERSADIPSAVEDILTSKAFDHGLAPSAEQCVIVDGCVEGQVRQSFTAKGAYFMTEAECEALARTLFTAHGCRHRHMMGQSAATLARTAGFALPTGTRVLMAERKCVTDKDPYLQELLAPVLSYYVEPDWMQACEKCLELLLQERQAQTLTIHSRDESVIHQFALKKPVARLLVNTGATFGGMGLTTNLVPALTQGSGLAGYGITTDNISPLNLIYRRKVGYGVRDLAHLANFTALSGTASAASPVEDPKLDIVRRVLHEALGAIQKHR